MTKNKIWMILAALLAGLVVAAPLAAAQDNGTDTDDGGEDDTDDGGDFDDDVETNGFSQCSTHSGLGLLSDMDSSTSQSVSRSQEVGIDEDDVLLAIALANNGASDIGFEDVRDVTVVEEVASSRDQTSDLEREDVFSALALGVDADEGDLGALSCVGDIHQDVVGTRTTTRTVNLDEEEVLLAIAINNAIGGGLELADVADIDIEVDTDFDRDTTFDLEREDAFLALALGAGGDGN